MIVIDGQQTQINTGNFKNLEEILVNVMEQDELRNRIVTDVLVNEEQFSEIYPHQAEDVDSSEIEKVEVVTVPLSEMAVSMTTELYKVIELMSQGGRQVADLFRQADDTEALEIYQDLLEVTRDFLGMVGLLREEFGLKDNEALNTAVEEISSLFSEIIEVQENEDWILLADLMEYEYIPVVEKWKQVIDDLKNDLTSNRKVQA